MKKSLFLLLTLVLLFTGCSQSEESKDKSDKTQETVIGQADRDNLKAEDLIDMSQCAGWASVAGNGLEGVTGGGDAKPQIVTTLEELTELARDNEPRVIVIDGTITSDGLISVGSNKTIVGIDDEALLQGGFELIGVANVIISNLNIDGTRKISQVMDCIAARGSHHLWFDHLNLWNASDGLLDLTMGSDYLTVSWCKFSYTSTLYEHRLSSLIGSGTGHDETDVGKLNVTYHHNWFAERCTQRMPRILYGKGHVYNNYYTSERNDYCIGVGCYASVLIENNYFKNVNNPHQFMYDTALPAHIVARGNDYEATTGDQDTGRGGIGYGYVTPFEKPPYEYTLDEAKEIPEIVSEGVGPRDLVADSGKKEEDGGEEGDDASNTSDSSKEPLIADKPILYDEATDTYTYQGQKGDGTNASYEIANPFAGMDLSETPNIVDGVPAWEKGVTISYWVYTSNLVEDAAVLNFNLADNRQMSNWDEWKYNVCKAYDKSDDKYSMGESETYLDKDGNKYTVLKGYGEYVCFNPDYPEAGCYYADKDNGVIPVYLKGKDKDKEENWTYIRHIGKGQYEGYSKRFDEKGGEDSLISEAEIDGSLSLYASGSVGYRQDNGTGKELNPNLPGYGEIAPIQVYNQFYYWGNGGQYQLDDSELKTPTMAEGGKWHFVVAIIKNDYIQYYMDGQEITIEYLNWWEDSATDENVAGASFNLGYGMSKRYRSRRPSQIWTTGMTILDFISNPNTVLTVGGTGFGAKDLGQDAIGTPRGVQVKEITFYDQPVETASVKADKIETGIQPLKAE